MTAKHAGQASREVKYVIVIPRSSEAPMEVIGIFGSLDKAEAWAVGMRLISWTACPVIWPDAAEAIGHAGVWAGR